MKEIAVYKSIGRCHCCGSKIYGPEEIDYEDPIYDIISECYCYLFDFYKRVQ